MTHHPVHKAVHNVPMGFRRSNLLSTVQYPRPTW